jgi:hypothetical protein
MQTKIVVLIFVIIFALFFIGYYFRDYLLGSSMLMRIIFAVAIAFGLAYLIYYAYDNQSLTSEPNPHYNVLVDGMVYGNKPLIFSNIPLSVNQPNGIEYTISSWVYINGNGMSDQYQYIFGRTDDTHRVNTLGLLDSNNPCVYIAPHSNNIVIICSTYTCKKDNRITLDNVPFQQWLNITITCKGSIIACYVNFKPIKEILLDSVPNQDGDIHIACTDYPFDGLISNLSYVPRALEIRDMMSLSGNTPNEEFVVGQGPSKKNISILDDSWF